MLNRINKRTKYIIGAIICLLAIFTISYVITGTYLEKKDDALLQKEQEEKDRIALQKEKNLGESIKVQYYTGDNKDSETTVKELKVKLKKESISLDELKTLAKEDGYELKNKGEISIAFTREKDSAFENGKYYLGFKDEKLAIYKYNNGEMKYELDVEHTKSKDELKLKGVKLEEIKAIENYEKGGSLEEIEDIASNYTS